MANQGRRPARRSGGGPGRQNLKAQGKKPASKSAPARSTPKTPKTNATRSVAFDAPPEEPRIFRLGAVAGATPGKWIDAWKARMPQVPLELVALTGADRRAEIDDVDAALVRLPLDDDSLHVIALYDEVPVVVASAESALMTVDELTADDLIGEVLVTPDDDVLGPLDLPGTLTPRFASIATTEEAIATVATGVGIVIVPMSLARLHHRKDADHRRLRDGPLSTMALVWPRERTTDDVETFVGIVRGRTTNSSR